MSSITIWNGLDMQIVNPSIDTGLEARVFDPMWMLARQWQFGEFRGEDAGSPISVRAEFNSAPVSRYHPEAGLPPGTAVTGSVFDAREQLLEPLVEGEPERVGTPSARVGIESGLLLLRSLRAAGLELYDAGFTRAFVFDPNPDPKNELLDAPSLNYLRLMKGRVPDGRAVYRHFQPRLSQPPAAWAWPEALPVPPADAAALGKLIVDWIATVAHHYEPRDPKPGAWDPSRQEYRFSMAAHDGASETVYSSDGYHHGRLDWDAFGKAPGVSLGAAASDPGPRSAAEVRVSVPGQLSFPGMPASRWWELEDSRVDFGGMEAGRTGLVRLLFIDYAVSYGNDWFLMPLEIPFGTVTRIRSLVVKDVFGVEMSIPPVSRAQGGSGWKMYTVTGEESGLLLPPVVGRVLEGQPIEEVRIVRDEAANMAWAVECLVQSDAGTPLHRHELARSATKSAPSSPASNGNRTLRYQLATTVPPHWIPLLPVRHSDPLMLERGEMLPDPDSGGQPPTRPLGRILEPERPRWLLHEEEAPRGGIRVTRSFQYARGTDGRTHLWIGRRKTPARQGEARSGLWFDVVR